MTGESFNNQPPSAEDELDAYAAGQNGLASENGLRQRRPRREFIRGPLPVDWFGRAARLPGQALAVALAIWFRRGIEKKLTFSLYPSALKKFGVSRWSAYRALEVLEEDGLIEVDRRRGRTPVVTLIEVSDVEAGESGAEKRYTAVESV